MKPYFTQLEEINEIFTLLYNYFKDTRSVKDWLERENLLLGRVSPLQMIVDKRTSKLLKFIKNQLEENNP